MIRKLTDVKNTMARRLRAYCKDVIDVAGVRLELTPRFSDTMLRVITDRSYERDELELVRSTLSPQDIVLEIGAGIGLLSTFCAQRIGSARIFTFEANPALEPVIRRTFALNKVEPSLEICLLGKETSGCTRFYVERDFWSSSVVRRSAAARPIEVPNRSLYETLSRIRPTYLIVDVEGAEYDLVQYFDYPSIRKIAIELHARVIGIEKTDYVRRSLSAAGFTVDERLSQPEQLFLTRSSPSDDFR